MEERTTSATGGQKGVKGEQYHVVPTEALKLLALQFGYGSLKYDDHNFRKGYEWSKTYDALQRHLRAFWGGEDYDEDGQPHMAAAAWHAMVLLQFWIEQPENDDRYTFTGDPERLNTIMRKADEAYAKNKEKWKGDA